MPFALKVKKWKFLQIVFVREWLRFSIEAGIFTFIPVRHREKERGDFEGAKEVQYVCITNKKNTWLEFHVHQMTLNLWQTFSLYRVWWNEWKFNCHLPVVLSGIINNISFIFETHCAKWTVPQLPYTRDHDKCCHGARSPFGAELD